MERTLFEQVLEEELLSLSTSQKVAVLNGYYEAHHYYEDRISEMDSDFIAENYFSGDFKAAFDFAIDYAEEIADAKREGKDYFTFGVYFKPLSDADIDAEFSDHVDDFLEDKDEYYVRESGVDFDYVEETARYNAVELCKEAFTSYSEDDIETAVDELFDLDLTEEEVIKEVGDYLKENCEEEVLN